jgi:hypothetical protein
MCHCRYTQNPDEIFKLPNKKSTIKNVYATATNVSSCLEVTETDLVPYLAYKKGMGGSEYFPSSVVLLPIVIFNVTTVPGYT